MTSPKSRIVLALCALALVASCGRVAESRFNPLNWFGGARETAVPGSLLPADYGAEDARPYVAQVTALRIERTSTGAIVHATGITPLLGYWNADLIEAPATEPGVITYQFRMAPPIGNAANGTPEQRMVHVGAALSNRALQDIRVIRVQSASNTLSVRR